MSTSNGTVPNVSAFVHDLVAMAKASEELPIVRGQLDEAKAESQSYFNMVQDREADITALKAQLDQLNSKLKATEAERDDAEIRFLELDEKAHTVLGVLDLIAAKSNDAKSQLEPPKPVEPEPVFEPVTVPESPFVDQGGGMSEPLVAEQVQSEVFPTTTTEDAGIPVGQSEPNPTASESTSSEANVTESSAFSTSDVSSPTPAPAEEIGTGTESVTSSSEPGQSETPFHQKDTVVEDTSRPSTTEFGGIEPAPVDSGTDAKPYEGKKYWLMTTYVSRVDWIAGGGAEEDYEWIPERDSAAQ